MSKNIFPAVRGVQNGVEYFLTTLSYNQIRQFITLPQDYLGDELLDPSLSMQRELQWTRIRNEMKPYLLRPDAFYSSLTLIMLPPGLPESFDEGKDYIFRPLKRSAEAEEESDEEWDALFGAGELVIFNDFTLFPGDGQHRAASIIEALKDVEYLRRDPDLARVRVPVVIVPFRARPRVQQLFADLNLHAKVPNKSIGISFEHNDPRALATKMLLSAVPLLENRVNQRATSLPETSPHVVTLYALSQANDILLDALDDAGLIANLDEVALTKGSAISDEERSARIQESTKALAEVWETLIASIPQWDEVIKGISKPNDLRREYVFAHGLGWLALAHVASAVIRTAGAKWKTVLETVLTGLDWSRANPEFQNVAVIGDRVNNTSTSIRSTAGFVLFRSASTVSDPNSQAYVRQYLKSLSDAQKRTLLESGKYTLDAQQRFILKSLSEDTLESVLSTASADKAKQWRALLDEEHTPPSAKAA